MPIYTQLWVYIGVKEHLIALEPVSVKQNFDI